MSANKETSSLFAEERRMRIVDYINQRKKATVQELSSHFAVSTATIRNDLRDLERTSQLVRTHGGALIKTQAAYEEEIDARNVEKREEKRRIGRAALELIRDGDSIVLDTGTTTYELARLLVERKNITVVTNDLRIALLLEQYDSVQVLVLGGMLRKHFHCTLGDPGASLLADLRVDKAFMGANSVSPHDGASTPDLHTAEIKKGMIAIAGQVVLLADSDKLNRRSFAKFASTAEIDMLVTDSMDKNEIGEFEQVDIDVIVAE